jgi:hypothetical protein
VTDSFGATDTDWTTVVVKKVEEWSFAIITDLHIGRGYPDYGGNGWNDKGTAGQDYYLTKRLNDVVQWIIDNHAKPQYNVKFVVVLGDIADSAEYSEFDKAKSILDRLDDPDGDPTTDDPIPYVPVIGNHDVWPYTEDKEADFPESDRYFRDIFILKRLDLLKSYFEEWESPLMIGKITWGIPEKHWEAYLQNYAFKFNGIKFIVLDCVARKPVPGPGKGVGSDAVLWDGTLTWLTENLDANTPTIIFSHHPFVNREWDAFSDFEIATIDESIKISKARVLANFAGHIHGWYPIFMNANKNYTEDLLYTTPAGISVITTEALMVGSNEPEPKGIIRIVKIKENRISECFVDGEFRSLNPYFKKIDIEDPPLGKITVEFEVYAFNKRFTEERPGTYILDFGDGSISEPKESKRWDQTVCFKHTYEGGKNYDVTLMVIGWTPDGEKIKERITRKIEVPSPWFGFIAKSPVDIIVTDPDGLTISNQLNQIPGAKYYTNIDFDLDGELDDIIAIPDRKIGDYFITVVPEPNAIATDTYTLLVWPETKDEPFVLAEGIQICNIPIQPYMVRSMETDVIPIIPATVDFNPDTLNLKSKGDWVTVYIELPIGHGYDVSMINLTTVMLNGQIYAEAKPFAIGDHDSDGIPDLMVKFNRTTVQAILQVGDQIKISISGKLTDGRPFEGKDTIQVILPP